MRYFKKIVGSLCYLSPVNPDDAEKYAEMLADLEVAQNLVVAPQIISLPAEREFVERACKTGYIFAIVDLESDALIGNCGLDNVDLINRSSECGIFIGNKQFWNKGYGTEAMCLLLDYAFSLLNLQSVMLQVYDFNTRAIRSYHKCGFKEIGRRRKARIIAGAAHDVIFMDILASEFTHGRIRVPIEPQEDKR